MAVVLAIGCGPTGSDDDTAPGPTESSTDATSGTVGSDGGSGSSGLLEPWPSGGCASLELPGDPEEIAASPRPDHLAEVLALRLEPERVVARQDHYETIVADLDAIRELDPTLEGLDNPCAYLSGVSFWWVDPNLYGFEDDGWYLDVPWQCHHEHFGVAGEYRIDGVASAIELQGVLSDAVIAAYAQVPGLEEAEIGRCVLGPTWCDPCQQPDQVTLTATFDGTNLAVREYDFFRTDGTAARYRVEPGAPPELVE